MATNIFVYQVEYVKSNMLPYQSGLIGDLETAQASIKCTFEESDRTTQFIANRVFVEGEEERVSSPLYTRSHNLSAYSLLILRCDDNS